MDRQHYLWRCSPQGEIEQCTYNFEASNPDMLTLFGLTSGRQQLLERGLVLPSLDYILSVLTPSIC